MARLASFLERLQRQWALGFTVLVVQVASAVVFGAVAALSLFAAFRLFGWDEAALTSWLLASAVLWLPLAVGATRSFLRDVSQDRRASEASTRNPAP